MTSLSERVVHWYKQGQDFQLASVVIRLPSIQSTLLIKNSQRYTFCDSNCQKSFQNYFKVIIINKNIRLHRVVLYFYSVDDSIVRLLLLSLIKLYDSIESYFTFIQQTTRQSNYIHICCFMETSQEVLDQQSLLSLAQPRVSHSRQLPTLFLYLYANDFYEDK